MKISTRINGRVTSVTMKDSICAIHYLICGDGEQKIVNHVLDTCHKIIDKWKGDTAKGLSSFITDRMIEDLLEEDEMPDYQTLIAELQ